MTGMRRVAVRAGWVLVFLVIAAVLIVLGTVPAGARTVAGHRGATGVPGVPEESQGALRYADRYGAAWAEGDVEFTADDYAVMIHDKTLDRTTGCAGRVADKTFAQLRACATDKEVPQLLFWLREAKRLGLSVNVEIRNGITAHQMAVFRRTIVAEAPAKVIVASWYPGPLEMAAAALGDRVRVAPIIGPTGSPFGYSVAEHAKRFDLILADYRWMIVARMHWYAEAGVAVWLWTASTPAAITRCRALANAEPTTSVIIADDVRKVNHG